MNKILGLIESGKKDGAKLCLGGKQHGSEGFYVQPTIFSNVKDDMQIAKEGKKMNIYIYSKNNNFE